MTQDHLASAAFAALANLENWRTLHVAQTGSTNADLATLAAREPDADRLWLTAGRQVSGKGRRGRVWVSPEGNLHASVLLRDPAPASAIGVLPLVAALAARDAIAAVIAPNSPVPKLKWPNDILIAGAKCCGILLERTVTGHVVAGFGINCIEAPTDTPYPATTLATHGAKGGAGTLFPVLAQSLAQRLEQFARGSGKKDVCADWLKHALGLGAPIRVHLAETVLEGIFEAIDDDGLLLLRMADGAPKRIAAGDVFFAGGGEASPNPEKPEKEA